MVVEAVSLVTTLRQLCLAVHKDDDPIQLEWSRSLEYALVQIETCPPADLTYQALESWNREKWDDTGATASDWFRRVLLTLPPVLVHRAFGEEVLGWIAFHHLRGEENFELYLKYCSNVLHLDLRELDLAKKMSLRRTTRVDSASVLKGLELMKALDGLDEQVEARFCKAQMKLSPEHLAEYTVVGRILPQSKDPEEPIKLYGYDLTWPRQPHGKQFAKWMPYHDAPLALYLVQKGRPQAILSFVPEGIDRLYVQQLQGLKGVVVDASYKKLLDKDGKVQRVSSRGLVPILWQELLLSKLAALGKQLGYKEVVIQGAKNNRWTRLHTDNTIHLPMERALKAYDEVADRLGAYDEDNGDWSISIRRLQRQIDSCCPQ